MVDDWTVPVIPEEWRPLKDYEGYEISNHGRVRSLPRIVHFVRAGQPAWMSKPGRLITLNPKPNGYHFVSLRSGHQRPVHQLVLETFVGPRPTPKHVVRHLNGDKTDNRVENLAWGTATENNRDTVLHGHNGNAAKTKCAKGHPFTPENTYLASSGSRYCRTCKRDYWITYNAIRRERRRQQRREAS